MRKVVLIIAGLAIFALLAAIGCNSRGGGGTGPGTSTPFKIHGIFVRDDNLTSSKDKAGFQLTRNDTLFNLAAFTIDTFKVDTTFFSTYYRQSPPDFLSPGQSHSINLVYAPNNLNFTTSLFMPDTFSVIVTDPATRINTGGQRVLIQWTGSANATGYLVACMHDTAQLDTSFFATSGATDATIPNDAFQRAGSPLPGTYKIFVIAFKGGLFPYSGMPSPIPGNYSPTDTIYSSTVSGRITAAFVCKYDSVIVP